MQRSGLRFAWIVGVALFSSSCDDSAGPPGQQGPAGETGAKGPQGVPGADGSLRIYGNGSAGDLTTAANPLGMNLQFASVSIPQGENLHVASGTVLRVAGSFTLNGAITVDCGSLGGTYFHNSAYADEDLLAYRAAVPGITGVGGNPGRAARFPGAARVSPGFESPGVVIGIGYPGPRGGAGGGGSIGEGGCGGGSLVVLARDGITIGATGAIIADGTDSPPFQTGGGGGGGGVVVLASATAISVAGSVSATGGDGARAFCGTDGCVAGGGGGGGGLVHLVAPTVNTTGAAIDVSEGLLRPEVNAAGGSNSVASGGGGGASAGTGGQGGAMTAGVYEAAANGTAGVSITTLTDPTSLF